MASKAMTNSLLQAIQRGQAEGTPMSDIDFSQIALPKEIIKRVNALKNIQFKGIEYDRKFHEELFQLELKYALLNEPLLDEREKIISGTHEPNDTEGTWYLDEEAKSEESALNDITNSKKEESLSTDLKAKTVITENADDSVIFYYLF
jgi:hypothetical protein